MIIPLEKSVAQIGLNLARNTLENTTHDPTVCSLQISQLAKQIANKEVRKKSQTREVSAVRQPPSHIWGKYCNGTLWVSIPSLELQMCKNVYLILPMLISQSQHCPLVHGQPKIACRQQLKEPRQIDFSDACFRQKCSQNASVNHGQ